MDATSGESHPAEERACRKAFWRIMPFLLACYVVSYLDRVNIGFAKLQMLQALRFSETVFGLGSGVFFLGYFVFAVPSNVLLHRLGARAWIAGIMIVWGLISALSALVASAAQFYALRFLLGLAESGFYPGVILYLTYWFPARLRGRTTTLFMSAIPVSAIFGNPLSGWIMDTLNAHSGLRGWQWMFLIEAVPAVLLGVGALLFLDNSVLGAKWLDEEEKQALAMALERDRQAQTAPAEALGAALANGWVWLMCLIYFCFVLGQYGLVFWLPSLVKAAGVSGNFHIGLVSAIPYVCTLIAMNLLGRSADRRRERRWRLAGPAIVGAIGFVVSASTGNAVIAIGALSLAAAGAISCAPLFWALPTAVLAGAGAAAGIGLINSVGNLAGFVAPFLVGYVKDATGDTALGMYIIAAAMLAGAVAVIATPARMVGSLSMPAFAANLTMMFNEWPFLDRFAAAADAGFGAVEFLFPYDHPPEAIADRLAANGLILALFNLPPGDWAAGERGVAALPDRFDEFRQGVDRALIYAEATGAWRVHMMAGLADPRDGQALARYRRALDHVAGKAGEAGAEVMLEPINGRDMPGYFLNDFALAQSIIAQAGAPNVKLQFDVYHRQILHGDVAMALRALMPIIGHVQIASVPSRHEPDGEELNYPFLFAELDRLGYAGFVGCEYRPRGATVDGLGWFRAATGGL